MVDGDNEILLLHADTIFESKRKRLPARAVSGDSYDLTQLAQEALLPHHIQFVWHGVNSDANIRQFVAADVQWAEVDARLSRDKRDIVLRNEPFDGAAADGAASVKKFDDVVQVLLAANKSVKIDLKENGLPVDMVIQLLTDCGAEDSRLWFNADIETLTEKGFLKLKKAFPGVIIQCPIDFLVADLEQEPDKVERILNLLAGWGIARFSVSWKVSDIQRVIGRLDGWGHDINIYNVPDLESFLKAVLLLPCSITADFNFPEWHYYGEGPGQEVYADEYRMHQKTFEYIQSLQQTALMVPDC